MKRNIQLYILAGVVLCLGLLATSAFAAGGIGPDDALIPTGANQTIAPNASLWYRFDYGGDKSLITALLDSYNADGLEMSVYLPQALADWRSGNGLDAIGAGGATNGHALAWTGRSRISGTYYIVVANHSTQSRAFQLTVTGDGVTTVFVPPAPTATPFPNPFATPVPVGSVAGGKILFSEARGGYFYTVNSDGSGLTKLTTGIDPVFSPNGAMIAFARQGDQPGIYVVNADGSNEHLVYGAQEVRSPAWSTDSARIVFSVLAVNKPGNSFCFRGRCFSQDDTQIWKLREVNVNDGTTHDINSPKTGAQSPTYKNDNNTIAFIGGEMGLAITTSDNSIDDLPVIAGDERITSPNYSPLAITAPVFSPDGTKIAFMVRQNPAWQIAISNADGSNVRLLTRIDPLDFQHPDNVAPAWSPDSSQVLFLSNQHGKWEFFAIGADGSNLRQVLQSVTDKITLKYTYNADRMISWKK